MTSLLLFGASEGGLFDFDATLDPDEVETESVARDWRDLVPRRRDDGGPVRAVKTKERIVSHREELFFTSDCFGRSTCLRRLLGILLEQ